MKINKSSHRLYKVFVSMKQRCYNSNCMSFSRYGAANIDVCKEWLDDYDKFFQWSIDNGYQVGKVIDRIDNFLGYSPENCRWVSDVVSLRNRRNVKTLNINGEVKSVMEWSAILDLDHKQLEYGVSIGMPIHLIKENGVEIPKGIVKKKNVVKIKKQNANNSEIIDKLNLERQV